MNPQLEAAGAYSELKPALIIETVQRLEQRIGERFPGSGLGRVAAQLHAIALQTERTIRRLRGPIWPLRIATVAAIAVLVGFALWMVSLLFRVQLEPGNISDVLQGSAAALNDVVFLSIAVFFLVSI